MINTSLKKNTNITFSPFCYVTPSVSTVSLSVIVLLFLQVLMLFVTKSFSSLLVLLSSVSSALLSETFYSFLCRFEKHSFRFSFIQGLLVGLLLPSSYPLFHVFSVVFITLLFSKYVFGSFSSSWVNVSCLCVVLLYFLNPSFFPPYLLTLTDLQGQNASLLLFQNGTVPILKVDPYITDFLNSYIFKFFGISIPEGYVSLFFDSGSLIPAFRFNLVTLLSSIILFSFEAFDLLVPSIFIFVYSLLVRFLFPFFVSGVPFQGDILLSLLTGGTLFCTLYLLQWYGTLPITKMGKILYAIIAGIIGFFLLGFGTSSVAFVFLVLIMNLISTFIQLCEDKRLLQNILKKDGETHLKQETEM